MKGVDAVRKGEALEARGVAAMQRRYNSLKEKTEKAMSVIVRRRT